MIFDKTDPEFQAALSLINAQLEAERKDKKIPGISIAVVHDQEIIWAKGFGYANLEKEIPANSKTIYRIGSLTKLFTATMLMQLRDAGKLQLDDYIEKYLPAFKIKSHFSDPKPPTFRQVVSHTSGLPREAPLDYPQTLKFPMTIEVVLESLKEAEMIFAPITEFKYSNLGIAIMGHSLELIANKPYKAYITKHILQALEMNSSTFNLIEAMKNNMAIGYIISEDKPPEIAPHPDLGVFAPAGQLYSSVNDMARFISLQFRDGPANGKQILGGCTLREMHCPVFMNSDWKSGIGIGWALSRVSDHPAIGHEGGIHGFTTDITLIPDMKLGIAVFTNTGTEPKSISRRALEVLIPIFQRMLFRKEEALSVAYQADWEKYTGYYSMPGLGEIEIKIVDRKPILRVHDKPLESDVILNPEGEHQFRMKGGPIKGELAIFALNEAGYVKSVKLGSYMFERKRKI